MEAWRSGKFGEQSCGLWIAGGYLNLPTVLQQREVFTGPCKSFPLGSGADDVVRILLYSTYGG